MKWFAALWPLGMLCAIVACFANDLPDARITVNPDTTRLEGWLSAKGEWMLFPVSNFENYSPYKSEESEKCVTLINGTGSERSTYRALHGKKVAVGGRAVRYDDLANGQSTSDRLLSKKYFKDEVVENFCLREFVFVASSIRIK